MAKWIDGFSPALIAARIERTKSRSNNDTVLFQEFQHTEHLALLVSMMSLNREILEADRIPIIRRAIQLAAEKGAVTAEAILKQVDALESAHLHKVKKRFRLVTGISLALPEATKQFKIDSSIVTIGWEPNKRTEASRNKLVEDARGTIYGDVPTAHTCVAVNVSARTAGEAATRALDDLDLLRGIWNFWKNRSHTIRISSGMRSPVNAMILAPIHTLHHLDGALAADNWWYEVDYRGSVHVWRDAVRAKKLLLFTAWFRNQLRKVPNAPYRDEIRSSVLRYVRALDSRDWNYTFLQLWSTLEALTGTTPNETHKVTVKRASFVFKDREYATQSLLHLRAYRNTAVHAGTTTEIIEPLMFQVKRAVEGLLSFHIARASQFRTMAQAAEFMDSPTDRILIDSKIRTLLAVRKYLIA